MKKHLIRLAAAGGAVAILLASRAMAAENINIAAGTNVKTDIGALLGTIINVIVGVSGTIFIILLVVGGIQYLTSAGNEEGVNKAKKLLIDAIIGLIITLAAFAIGKYVIGALGVTGTTLR